MAYTYRVLSGALFGLLASGGAHAQAFPCAAFQMQPNGMLAVVQSVTITNGGASATLNPGAAFGSGATIAGVNLHAAYQQFCR